MCARYRCVPWRMLRVCNMSRVCIVCIVCIVLHMSTSEPDRDHLPKPPVWSAGRVSWPGLMARARPRPRVAGTTPGGEGRVWASSTGSNGGSYRAPSHTLWRAVGIPARYRPGVPCYRCGTRTIQLPTVHQRGWRLPSSSPAGSAVDLPGEQQSLLDPRFPRSEIPCRARMLQCPAARLVDSSQPCMESHREADVTPPRPSRSSAS